MTPEFLTALSVEEVVRRLSAMSPLEAETVPLSEADGRVLHAPVRAAEDLPAADRCGMDGYAVIAADLFGTTETAPVWLECVGQVPIDRPADFTLQSGQCAAVATGSHLPPGADAVIMVEYTREFGAGIIEMRRPVAPGAYVMRRGEDTAAGRVALPAGTLLRAQEIGLLAALGIDSASVFRRPRVAVLSTGDEVVAVDATPAPGQIRDVNSHTLACLVRRAGGAPVPLGIVPDDLQALTDALRKAAAARNDVILLSGGSSVGVRDLTVQAVESLEDAEVFCHGVAISPGKPLILARSGNTVIWGLPGQVTSAQVVMHVLGAPFLRHLSGSGSGEGGVSPFEQSRWPRQRAVLSRNTASRQGREDYVRVRLSRGTDGVMQAEPVTGLSGLLRTLLRADGVARIAAELEGLEAGSEVDVLLFDRAQA